MLDRPDECDRYQECRPHQLSGNSDKPNHAQIGRLPSRFEYTGTQVRSGLPESRVQMRLQAPQILYANGDVTRCQRGDFEIYPAEMMRVRADQDDGLSISADSPREYGEQERVWLEPPRSVWMGDASRRMFIGG